jgi:putative toxin-antitoxin system antitoxin component (TIGR02293 family)
MSEFKFEDIIREEGVAYAPRSEMDRVEMARKGISKKSLLRIAEISGVSIKDLAKMLPVSLRTIQRYNEGDLLDPHVSDRAILIAEVLVKGLEVLGSREKLQTWLQTPLSALGVRPPFSLLDTGIGARMVMDVLGRIEHGVFS